MQGREGVRLGVGWGEESRLPSFPLEPLVIASPSFPSVTSSWGFIYFFVNLDNLFVFETKPPQPPLAAL